MFLYNYLINHDVKTILDENKSAQSSRYLGSNDDAALVG